LFLCKKEKQPDFSLIAKALLPALLSFLDTVKFFFTKNLHWATRLRKFSCAVLPRMKIVVSGLGEIGAVFYTEPEMVEFFYT